MDAVKKNICPVCGYCLNFVPWDGELPADEMCPCCGLQFGYDDFGGSSPEGRQLIYDTWRVKWINSGMKWQSVGISAPQIWDPILQLKTAGLR
ncbi:MAG: hypothetical protein ACKOS8_02355 [Gemmataceae bacterium]